jgi:hypothetical protein
MLVLRLEMWPEGDRSKARVLGVLRVSNVGGGLDEGDYQVELDELEAKETRSAQVTGWMRGRSAWALVFEALTRLGVSEWRRPPR